MARGLPKSVGHTNAQPDPLALSGLCGGLAGV